MPTIFVPFLITQKSPKESIQQELRWYDPIKKEMVILHGGKLEFKYKEDPYLVRMGPEGRRSRGIRSTFRLLPEAVDLRVINYNKNVITNNKSEVEKWFRDYLNYNNSGSEIIEVDGNGVTFQVPKDEVEDFTYSCERRGLAYET